MRGCSMMPRNRALLFILMVFAAAMYPRTAAACSCTESALPCGSVAGSTVFIWTVQARLGAAPQRTSRDPGSPSYTLEFTVIEALAGVSGPKVTVRTAQDEAACGYTFEVGESYLVYATPVPGGYATGLCSRTRRLADARDDLIVLRHAAKGQTISRVFGRVVRHEMQVDGEFPDTKAVGPEIGVPVVAKHGELSVETITDSDGRFVFEDLPPGQYQIEPRWPRGMKSRFPPEPVTVERCGAGDIHFWAVTDAPLRGIVRGPEGAPVNKSMIVTAIRFDPNDLAGARAPDRSTFAFTDEKGEYAFDGLPAGRYLVGVNPFDPPFPDAPYPAIYHPGASDMARAVPVTVSAGQQIRIDLRLPPRLPSRLISGVVVDEQGLPVAGASLTLFDSEFSPHPRWTLHATSDNAGRFEVEAIGGRSYVLDVVSYKPALRGRLTVSPQTGSASAIRVIVR